MDLDQDITQLLEQMEMSEQTNNPLVDSGDEIDIDDMLLESIMMDGVLDAPPPPRPTVSLPGHTTHWSDEQNRPYWRNENTGLTTWCGPRRWLPLAPPCPPAVLVLCSSPAYARLPYLACACSFTQRLRSRRRIEPVSRTEQRAVNPQRTRSARELDFDSGSPRFDQEMPLGQAAPPAPPARPPAPPPAPPRLVGSKKAEHFTRKWSEEKVGRCCR